MDRVEMEMYSFDEDEVMSDKFSECSIDEEEEFKSPDDSKIIEDIEGNVRQVTFRDHASKAIQGMKELRDDGELLDLALKVTSHAGIEVIFTHSCVLAAHSPFIRAFLRNEKINKVVDLLNWSKENIKTLVDWMYEGILKIQPSNCYELFESSDYLCLHEVTKECASYIYDNLSLENCCEAYIFSCCQQSPSFKEQITEYILKNFSGILKENHLTSLPKETFMSFLEDDNLMLVNEYGFPILPHEEEIVLLKLLKNYISQNSIHDLWPAILKRVIRFGVIEKSHLEQLLNELIKWFENCKEKKECIQILQDIKLQEIHGKSLFKVHERWGKNRKSLQNIKISWTDFVPSSPFFPYHGAEQEFDDVNTILEELKDKGEPPLLYVTGMKLYTNTWQDRLVISTIEVTYNTGQTILHGHVRDDLKPDQFTLLPEERIVSTSANTEWLVDCLSFETNLGRKFGPYGGQGGAKRDIHPKHPGSYLAGLTACVESYDGVSYTSHIRFAWASFNLK